MNSKIDSTISIAVTTAFEFNHQLKCLETKLARYALSLTNNREDAKDLLQDTMLKALKFKDQFVQHTNLKAWTYVIMKNTFINNYRKAVLHNTTFDNTRDLFLLNQKMDTKSISPESAYATIEINRMIDNLGDEFKVPFKMYTEGYKYKEIAQKLGLNIGTVKSRIFFTRKKLMDELNDYK